MMSYLKKALHISLLFGVLLLCAGHASAAGYGVGTVSGDGLRLRAESSMDAAVLTTASSGDHVLVLEDAADGWYRVSWQSQEGYMSADYLDVVTEAEEDLGYGMVNTDGDSLNVRSGPGTDYDRVTSLSNGTMVSLIGFQNGWFHIEHNGETGYVSSDYMTMTSGAIGGGAGSAMGQQIVAYAQQFLGTPYVYGGNGPNSFDCSGFVKYVFTHFGYNINRTASTQLSNGYSVEKSQLQPGDIVFFRNKGDSHPASHVGIYVGGDQFIHASSDTRQVEFSSLVTSNNAKKYIAARRIV